MALPSLKRIIRGLAQRFIHGPLGGGKPVPETALDAEYSSGRWNHFFNDRELPRYQALVELLKTHGAQPPSVLDIGCGSGRLASVLSPDSFSNYTGMDLSREGLRIAGNAGIPRTAYVHGNFETWRPSQRFDVIVFNEVIGYAHDPAATIAAFLPFLNPNGRIVVSLYQWGNYAAIWKRIGRRAQVIEKRAVHGTPGVIWDIQVLADPASLSLTHRAT